MAVIDDVRRLVEELSEEELRAAKRYLECLHEGRALLEREQAPQESGPSQQSGGEREAAPEPKKGPWLYPTVPLPASVFLGLIGLIDAPIGGDALADTEALYDEA